MPRLHLPRSSYDFLVCDFPYDFSGHPVRRRLWLQYMRTSYDFLLWRSTTFWGKTIWRSCGNHRVSEDFKWRSYGISAMSLGLLTLSPCDPPTTAVRFLSRESTIITGSPYGARRSHK